MRSHTRVYWLPKAGSSESEYQDAFSFDGTNEGYSSQLEQRFAVSDGASEAIYSGDWAKILTNAWFEGGLDLTQEFQIQLKAIGDLWDTQNRASHLPWWAEQKLHAGSFATLAGLILRQTEAGATWEIQVVGDSCVFVLQKEALAFQAPYTDSRQFETSPYLIASNSQFNDELNSRLVTARGELALPTEFLIMTDAVACWFMKQIEAGVSPLALSAQLDCEQYQQAFEELVMRARERGEMRNDDVTLLSIQVWQESDGVADTSGLR